MDVLDLLHGVPFDDTITHMEWHTHYPYASMTLNNNDEIRIPIQQQDLCVIPSMSYVYVEGKLTKAGGTVSANTKFTSNAFAYLFDEMRYEINAVEVDRVRNPGITTTLKSLVSFTEASLRCMSNSGWPSTPSDIGGVIDSSAVDSNGNFNFCVPLNTLFGFAEDYKKAIVNARHELVLIRSSNDKNALKWTSSSATDLTPDDVSVKLTKLCWRIPYITLSDRQRLALLKHLERGTSIPVEYRSWELYEYPSLPQASKHSWSVKTANQLERPRYVIVAFQEDRKNNIKKSAAKFDHFKLNNLKLHLNSISYPYDDLKLDFTKNNYAVLYDMYARFQESYYNLTSQPLLTKTQFKDVAPIVVIDCSKQNESIRSAPVDIRIEFETGSDVPANGSAFCLILHDKSFEYEPSTGRVLKGI
jgi:hypothetical protein